MIKKKKMLIAEALPEFEASIEAMPEDSRIFVDKSMEIADYIFRIMEVKGMKQKDLATALGKTEAEISKWLAGMHNYTLRSLAKMEAALGETIICTAKKYAMVPLTYKHNYHNSQVSNVTIIGQAFHAADYNKGYCKVVNFKKHKTAPGMVGSGL
jgi:transcriptional regulator with XRE-family HTH domain